MSKRGRKRGRKRKSDVGEHKAVVTYYNSDKKKTVTKTFKSQRVAARWARGETDGRKRAFARIVGPLYVISWKTAEYEKVEDKV